MLLALFTYLIWSEIREEKRYPEDDEQLLLLALKGVLFTVFWPLYIVGFYRHLETPRQKYIWVLATSPFVFAPLILMGIWNYLALGVVLAFVKAALWLYVAYRIHLRMVDQAENE